MKGESAEEISAAAQVMRDLMKRVELHTENVVDIVGTGGDGANLFNVSTASSFVAAAGGAHVAKHGNRSVSSSSGSAIYSILPASISTSSLNKWRAALSR